MAYGQNAPSCEPLMHLFPPTDTLRVYITIYVSEAAFVKVYHNWSQ